MQHSWPFPLFWVSPPPGLFDDSGHNSINHLSNRHRNWKFYLKQKQQRLNLLKNKYFLRRCRYCFFCFGTTLPLATGSEKTTEHTCGQAQDADARGFSQQVPKKPRNTRPITWRVYEKHCVGTCIIFFIGQYCVCIPHDPHH